MCSKITGKKQLIENKSTSLETKTHTEEQNDIRNKEIVESNQKEIIK